MATTQPYELEAWLGDNRGNLTDDQFNDLLATTRQIDADYPDEVEDAHERETALTVAYRILTNDDELISDLAEKLVDARRAETEALAGLRQAAITLIPRGWSENSFARFAGVDRMTVRSWLGKR